VVLVGAWAREAADRLTVGCRAARVLFCILFTCVLIRGDATHASVQPLSTDQPESVSSKLSEESSPTTDSPTADETTVEVGHVIARGESFHSILARYGVSGSESRSWYEAARTKQDLNNLQAGRVLHMTFSPTIGLVGIRYDLDRERWLTVERSNASELEATIEKLPENVRPVLIQGVIHSSFYQSAMRKGVPEPIIAQMADILGSALDFGSDVHPGDRFRVLYEERLTPDGRLLSPGRVLTAEFKGRAASASALLYENENGESTYVDAQGRGMDGSLLRYPLEFTRITSAFSSSRFHPILKIRRPHLGVDFAAPSGTPVRAVGNGIVRWAGWKGTFGRHVEIDHGGDLASAYSHLRGIHPSVKQNSRVKRGQIIGWVGQSGQATGPHLHFAIFEKGRYVNPLRLRNAPAISRVEPARFRKLQAELAQQLRVARGGQVVASSTPPILLSPVAAAQQLGPVTFTM
jgi:murein DD-endopeptidase MepM/ murein hydrolase activator NlpD